MDDLDEQIQAINKQLRALSSEHRYMPLLMTVPGIGFVLSYVFALRRRAWIEGFSSAQMT